MNHSKTNRLIQTGIILLLLLVSLTAAIQKFTQGNAFGNDYYIFYLAGKSVIAGENPYSDEVAHQAQLGVLKRAALPGEDQLGFAYPLYALAAVLPTLWLPYNWAQALWMAINLLALVASFLSLLSSLRKTQKISPGWMLLAIFPLVLYPMFYGILMGNFVLLITAVLLFFLSSCLRSNHLSPTQQVIYGICLVWCSIKPQFVWLFFIIILLYSLQKHLWLLLGSSAVSFILLNGLSFFIAPRWPYQWLDGMGKYSQYNQTWPDLIYWLRHIFDSQSAILIGLAIFIPAFLLTVVFIRRWIRGQLNIILLLAWCGFLTYLVHPHAVSYEQFVFIFPFVVWLFHCVQRTSRAAIISLAAVILSWGSFFLARIYHPLTLDLLPYLPFLFWLCWLYYPRGANSCISTSDLDFSI